MRFNLLFLMIRCADESDFNAILDLSQEFWRFTQFTEPFERQHTLKMVELAHDHGLLAVIDDETHGVVGFSAGVLSPAIGSSQAIVGTELAWWVSPKYRRGKAGIKLLRFMEDLAKERGIKYWNMASMESSMPAKVNAIYEKMGYTKTETLYTKVI